MGQKNDNVKLLNIDWLQFAVLNNKGNLLKKNWVKQDYQTRLFSDIYHYMIDGIVQFELVCNPKSKIINEKLCIIKVSNENLYNANLIEMVEYLIYDESFQFNNFTRLDICCDFAKFDNDMYPDELINNFLSERFLKNNQSNFKLIGNQTYYNQYSYLRFGSGTSSVSAYIYNKNQEFRDVKHKVYISEMWKKNGLFSSCDIWRLEFSIKDFKNVLTCKESGQQIIIDLEFLSNLENLKILFAALYDKYFDFRVNANNMNKSRMKRVNLFEVEQFKTCWYSERENLNSDRSDKIMIKKLHNMQNELREIKSDYELEIEELKEYLIRKKNLVEWAKDRQFTNETNHSEYSKFYNDNEKEQINSLYNI